MALAIKDVEHGSSGIALKSIKVLVHILPVGEITLHAESNGPYSYETGCSVDNDNVKIRSILTVYIARMCPFAVELGSSEELEHRNVMVVLVFVRIAWHVPVLVAGGSLQ